MRRALLTLFFILHGVNSHATEAVTHQQSLNSAPLEAQSGFGIAGVGGFVFIHSPMTLGVHANLIYFYDFSKQLVYRYNLVAHSMVPINQVTSHLKGVPSAITVDSDGSFYIADPFGHQVLHFNMSGDLVGRYESLRNMNSPVAMVRSYGNKLLVADSLYGHVLVFNYAGQPLYAFGERGTGRGQFLEPVDMARGPDGIYVLDRLVKQVMVFSEEGRLIREMPREEVQEPSAIAVDYAERVYISDAADDTIKVYDRHGLRETFGGTGGEDGQFRIVSDMQADGNFLYVADSANNRIQVFILEAAFTPGQGQEQEPEQDQVPSPMTEPSPVPSMPQLQQPERPEP